MSRTIEQVKSAIIADMSGYPELQTLLTNTSKRSIWYLFIYCISASIVVLESLMDIFKSDLETIASASAAATPLWLQDKIFKFQYNSATPQIVKLDVAGGTFAPIYDIINPNLCIVKKTSILTTATNYVNIKVAKDVGGELGPLTSDETNALQGYVNIIGAAGINYAVSSNPANKLYWTVDILYDAQYVSVIKQNIQTSMTNFLTQIPFDGVFRVNQFESYILTNTVGVIDLTTKELSIREDSQTVAEGIQLVTGQDIVRSNINPTSGYITSETNSGDGILDGSNITLIAY
jgi:hypothetical protein